MNSEDVRNVTFEQTKRGYRVEDVDDFLQQVAGDMDALTAEANAHASELADLRAQIDTLRVEREDIENKLYILAEKVEEYRNDEDTLKTALLSAQRMGDTVLYEARQKAELMVSEATEQAAMLRQKAEQDIVDEKRALETLADEVSRFKSTVLTLYKEHIESMSSLDAPVKKARSFLTRYETTTEKDMVEKKNEDVAEPSTVVEDEFAQVETEVFFEQEALPSAMPTEGNGALGDEQYTTTSGEEVQIDPLFNDIKLDFE